MIELLSLAYEYYIVPDLIQLRKRKLEIESGRHDFRKDVLSHEQTHTERQVFFFCLTVLFPVVYNSGNTYCTGKHPNFWGSFPDTLRKRASPISSVNSKIIQHCDITSQCVMEGDSLLLVPPSITGPRED